MITLNHAYLQGLAARNRLTDARSEVHRLYDALPDDKRSAVTQIYADLCHIQGVLENLLEDVPHIYNNCQIRRIKHIGNGHIDAKGNVVITHGDVAIEPCNNPLLEVEERRCGVCHSCQQGWEVASNKFASEQERARAQKASSLSSSCSPLGV